MKGFVAATTRQVGKHAMKYSVRRRINDCKLLITPFSRGRHPSAIFISIAIGIYCSPVLINIVYIFHTQREKRNKKYI